MLFLASIVDLPVQGKTGEVIGKLEDLIVRIGDERYPPIAGLVVRDGVGGSLCRAPVSRRSMASPGSAPPRSISSRLHAATARCCCARMCSTTRSSTSPAGGSCASTTSSSPASKGSTGVVGVDISPQALLRRLGPRALSDRIVGRQIIDWNDVQYLASAAPVQLKVSYDRLAELNPVDLARIVDALSYRESAEIVAALDEETAAETLEEVSDERLADLLEGWTRSAPPTSWRR